MGCLSPGRPGALAAQGKRGESVMWVSSGFRRKYAAAQAVKLAVIDSAFAACFGQAPVEALPAAMPRPPRSEPLYDAA